MARILFTVTTDLSYDQRMQRIATTMQQAGYKVLLAGRKQKSSPPLQTGSYRQTRLFCFFSKGFLFYAEFNFRLFFYLLFQKADIFCAVDLDTIMPVYLVSFLKKKKRVYDAHELFTEMKEVISNKRAHRCWLWIEKTFVPGFPSGYTVNQWIADEFKRRYNVHYDVIRNLPIFYDIPNPSPQKNWIIYQGAVNEGRSFETLIPAIKEVDAQLLICGKGNFFEQAVQLVRQYELESKIIFKGAVAPEALKKLTPTAYLGVTLFEALGMNQYHSLANRFFDYCMAGIPQLCVNYPEYAAINQQYRIALLIDDTRPETIAAGLNTLLTDPVLYKTLQQNCYQAREFLNWQQEEKALLLFYQTL